MTDPYERWRVLEKKAREGGGAERVAKHRAAGKLTARERLASVFDAGAFVERATLVTHRAATREWKPIVHQLTNYVVRNHIAKSTRAIGARPGIAHASEEVEEIEPASI